MSLKGKTMFVTGGSRGIGLAIALRAAQDGANIAIASKTSDPNPKLPGTIFTAAAEIEKAGGQALPIQCDIRFEEQIQDAISKTVEKFGGIDIVLNNASAKAGKNPHILVLSPPLSMKAKWFKPHLAYTMAKYGMSMCVLGLSEELKRDQIAVNALWPRTAIDTAALAMIPGVDAQYCRKPEILSDSAYIIFNRKASECSGNFFIDDEVLASEGITDLSKYAVVPGNTEFIPDLFID
ncbi:MAG: hypothetical protein RLZZ378_510 [Actinomycetota bacterium]